MMIKKHKAPKVIAGAKATFEYNGEFIAKAINVSVLGKNIITKGINIILEKDKTLKELKKSTITVRNPVTNEILEDLNKNFSIEGSVKETFTKKEEPNLEEPSREIFVEEEEDEDDIIEKVPRKVSDIEEES